MLLLPPSKPLKVPPGSWNNTNLRQEATRLCPQAPRLASACWTKRRATCLSSVRPILEASMSLTYKNFSWIKPEAGHGVV